MSLYEHLQCHTINYIDLHHIKLKKTHTFSRGLYINATVSTCHQSDSHLVYMSVNKNMQKQYTYLVARFTPKYHWATGLLHPYVLWIHSVLYFSVPGENLAMDCSILQFGFTAQPGTIVYLSDMNSSGISLAQCHSL